MISKHASLALFALLAAALGTPSAYASDSVSPDKQWEYKCVDGVWSEIQKAGTTEVVLDLSTDVSVPWCHNAEVVWAPDSKRFAFNYTPPHAPHSTYETIALYQLRDEKWVALPSPVDETSERSQVAQLAHLPKNRDPRDAELLRDVLKVRSWTDSNTAILYSHAIWVGGSRDTKTAFLFTLKFDAQGKSKIVKTQKLPAKAIDD
jgi:D-alanyl-D-alanine dipeptidase